MDTDFFTTRVAFALLVAPKAPKHPSLVSKPTWTKHWLHPYHMTAPAEALRYPLPLRQIMRCGRQVVKRACIATPEGRFPHSVL
jgi:hypothetical protein